MRKKKVRVAYKVTIARRYVFTTHQWSFTFNTQQDMVDIHNSELMTVIKFRLKNKGLSVCHGMEILSKTIIK